MQELQRYRAKRDGFIFHADRNLPAEQRKSLSTAKGFISEHREETKLLSRRRSGFTLIELLLYMGLVGIFLTAATTSMWDIILGNVKSSVEQEVQESLRYSSSRLGFEIRNADSVGSSSDFDVNLADNPGTVLSLNVSSPDDPTEFRVTGGLLQVKQGGGDWASITSPAVEVTNLVFTDLTDAASENIKFTVTVKYRNPSDRSEWEKSATFEGAAQLR